MTRDELKKLWSETLAADSNLIEPYDRLARAAVDLYNSPDERFQTHIKNRFKRIAERTGEQFDPENFNVGTARAFIADEVGLTSWNELTMRVESSDAGEYPMLFRYAIAALERGDFTALEETVGGPDAFNPTIRNWYEAGYFANEPETLAEAFAAACMLGHAETAEYLLDKGVDPYAGMKTGLAGYHYAASSGRLDVIRMLIAKGVRTDVKNMYNGDVWGQALWSAVHEHTPDHAPIIEALIEAGVEIEPGTLGWWEMQDVPSEETKVRVAEALRRASAA